MDTSAELKRLTAELAAVNKRLTEVLLERDMYGQRWRHWEIQANALLSDATAWREHQRNNGGHDMSTENLTVAYVAIGAYEAIDGCLPDDVCDRYGGQLGYIRSVIYHADMIERLAEGRDFNGVFAYDVCEEFGLRYGKALLEGRDVDSVAMAKALIEEHSTPSEVRA